MVRAIAVSVVAIVSLYSVEASLGQTIWQYAIKSNGTAYDPQKDWWKNAVFYQIYPRSFKDGDDDGIGDLRGIIEKLDYLKDAGVTATWLSPIFLSPQKDQGYDIQDYYEIQPEYGTKDDLTELLNKAHVLGIKIILDFVPNHTSDLHEWFQASVNGTEKYKDYYVWRDGKFDKDGNFIPPSNWISNFKDSAWEWNDNRKKYYLHQFAIQQPDLNYRNPNVVEDMKNVLRYWLDFGVDGFRIDAVPTLFEDEKLRDEPVGNNPNAQPNDYDYLDHIYTLDQDETFDMVYQWRQVLEDFNKDKDYPRVIMTETYTPIDKIFKYYGSSNGTLGAHFTFNFNFITGLSRDFTIDDLLNCINSWLSNIPQQYVSNWVLGNHDQHRVANRLGKDNIDAFNILASILPGVQVTYNGEEIGMEDGEVTCDQGFDPQAKKNCSTFNETSRDFERTPFQWDDTNNGGFSTNSTTWLPVSQKYKEVNLKIEQGDNPKTHYNIYKKAVELKTRLSNTTEDLIYLVNSSTVLEIIRKTDSVEYVYLYNAGDQDVTITPYLLSEDRYVVAVTSIDSTRNVGDALNRNEEVLAPHESVIFEKTDNVESSAGTYQIATILLMICHVIRNIL